MQMLSCTASIAASAENLPFLVVVQSYLAIRKRKAPVQAHSPSPYYVHLIHLGHGPDILPQAPPDYQRLLVLLRRRILCACTRLTARRRHRRQEQESEDDRRVAARVQAAAAEEGLQGRDVSESCRGTAGGRAQRLCAGEHALQIRLARCIAYTTSAIGRSTCGRV